MCNRRVERCVGGEYLMSMSKRWVYFWGAYQVSIYMCKRCIERCVRGDYLMSMSKKWVYFWGAYTVSIYMCKRWLLRSVKGDYLMSMSKRWPYQNCIYMCKMLVVRGEFMCKRWLLRNVRGEYMWKMWIMSKCCRLQTLSTNPLDEFDEVTVFASNHTYCIVT